MITTTAEYALRATVFLAACDSGTVSREEISSATQVPMDYLVKVMKMLDQAGITQSQRGPGGGYRLAKSAEDLSVYDVVAAVSELPRIETCPLGIAEHINLCPLHARLDSVAALTESAFRETPLSELVPRKGGKSNCSFPKSV
ncbi:MAG: Rrf2 family transcriptional regulator [Planctomycetales bacterium]|nr:Rrf2 family transcriptional regulator [Planctomycetales bacterium]